MTSCILEQIEPKLTCDKLLLWWLCLLIVRLWLCWTVQVCHPARARVIKRIMAILREYSWASCSRIRNIKAYTDRNESAAWLD